MAGFVQWGGGAFALMPLAKELPPLDLGCHLTVLSRYDTAPAKFLKSFFVPPYKNFLMKPCMMALLEKSKLISFLIHVQLYRFSPSQ